MSSQKSKKFPDQKQVAQPGDQHKMKPEPEVIRKDYQGSGKLKSKIALIAGGDSGIGRSIAVHFAREGADVAIVYLDEDKDAEKTKELVNKENKSCLLLRGDLKEESFCRDVVEKTIKEFGALFSQSMDELKTGLIWVSGFSLVALGFYIWWDRTR